MDFYNDLITEKSWQTLQSLRNKLDFILIGGWAVYLYTKAMKSKDIDIIVNYDQLEILRKDFVFTKNDRLKKYEARRDEVQIDIYLPYYSNLGLPVEEIIKDTKMIEAFILPSQEMMLILKLYTYNQRKLSAKGQKDLLDIMSLLSRVEIDWKHYNKLLVQFDMKNYSQMLIQLFNGKTNVPELNLNQHAYSKLKKKVITNL